MAAPTPASLERTKLGRFLCALLVSHTFGSLEKTKAGECLMEIKIAHMLFPFVFY